MEGWRWGWVLGLLLGLGVGTVLAQEGPRIQVVTPQVLDGMLTVSFRLEGGFPPPVVQELQEGVSREFFYYVLLYRMVPGWYDVEVAEQVLHYRVKYHLLTQTFQVWEARGGHWREARTFSSYEDLVRWISRISRVPLIPVSRLRPHRQYYIKVRAEMKAGPLPLPLRYLLFFVPYSRFHTPWARSPRFSPEDLP